MFIKYLRLKMHLSQEELAERAKMSLRTVQRVESGHRVSFRSLRALASVFSIDVDELERELYAMKTTEKEYVEIPLWVRIVLGHGLFFGSRSHLHKLEVLCISIGVGSLVFWIASMFLPYIQDPVNGSLYFGLFMLFCAYWASVCIRVGERHGAWSLYDEVHRDADDCG